MTDPEESPLRGDSSGSVPFHRPRTPRAWLRAGLDRRLPLRTDDGLRERGAERFYTVPTHPPFGRKSSTLVLGENGDTEREAITRERRNGETSIFAQPRHVTAETRSGSALHRK